VPAAMRVPLDECPLHHAQRLEFTGTVDQMGHRFAAVSAVTAPDESSGLLRRVDCACVIDCDVRVRACGGSRSVDVNCRDDSAKQCGTMYESDGDTNNAPATRVHLLT
jgi:hypothetical protein